MSACRNLLDTGFYLGTNTFRDNVRWVRDGRANRLAVDIAQPLAEDHTGTIGEGATRYSSPSAEAELILAPLCAIVQISSSDYWLTADCGYCGPSVTMPSLANVKPSCMGEWPDVEPFRAEFTTVMENLQWLQAQTATLNLTARCGLFPITGAEPRFNVRHVLFKVCHFHTLLDLALTVPHLP
jgi:hypothetical protein